MSNGFSDSQPEFILGDVRILRHNSEPCVVCGHPTGDCAGEMAQPLHIWGTTEVPSLVDTNMVLVDEDIIEYRQITPFSKSKVLVARAGQQIPASRARELGII